MFRLTPSSAVKIENVDTDIIVSNNLRTSHIYKNTIEIFDLVNTIHDPCFYEVLSERKKRKMYFDIDIPDKDLIDIEKMIDNIYTILYSILSNPIILVTKSTNSNVKKCGVHIIIVNYIVPNVYFAKRFFNTVFEKVDPQYQKFLDEAVYKSIQQFRILNCSKYQEHRKKIFYKILPKLNLKVNSKIIFDLSLITSNYATSEYFETFTIPEECCVVTSFSNEITIDQSSVINNDESNLLIKRAIDSKIIDFSCFDKKEVKGIFIILKRLRPSHCPNCDRKHENENAFLYTKHNKIMFGCRRNNKKLDLGYFLTEQEIQERESQHNENIKDINLQIEKNIETVREKWIKYFSS